jgi:hypothetical protein
MRSLFLRELEFELPKLLGYPRQPPSFFRDASSDPCPSRNTVLYYLIVILRRHVLRYMIVCFFDAFTFLNLYQNVRLYTHISIRIYTYT